MLVASKVLNFEKPFTTNVFRRKFNKVNGFRSNKPLSQQRHRTHATFWSIGLSRVRGRTRFFCYKKRNVTHIARPWVKKVLYEHSLVLRKTTLKFWPLWSHRKTYLMPTIPPVFEGMVYMNEENRKIMLINVLLFVKLACKILHRTVLTWNPADAEQLKRFYRDFALECMEIWRISLVGNRKKGWPEKRCINFFLRKKRNP